MNSIKRKPLEGLIGEYLSKLQPDETSSWDLSYRNAIIYVNVGLWEHKRYFKKAITTPKTPAGFEVCLRERAWFLVKKRHEVTKATQ